MNEPNLRTNPTIFVVTTWSVESSGATEPVDLNFFTDYNQAVNMYGKRWDNETCLCGNPVHRIVESNRVINKCDCGQNYVSISTVDATTGLQEFCDFEDGSWKRP